MDKYIAFSWNPFDEVAERNAKTTVSLLKASSENWYSAIADKGFLVLISVTDRSKKKCHKLTEEAGVIFGDLFKIDGRGASRCVSDDINAHETHEICTSGGLYLTQNYWGGYLAFFKDKKTDNWAVLRDPIGSVPCYRTTQAGLTIYFSDISDLAARHNVDLSIDWGFLNLHLFFPRLRGARTALKEVVEVLPGSRELKGLLSTQPNFLWKPQYFALDPLHVDRADAAELLRRAALDCVSAWASKYDRILHMLGGLDSSIITACLSRASSRPEVTCLNLYTPTAEGDEREYAQLVANHCGFPIKLSPRFASKSNKLKYEDYVDFPLTTNPIALLLPVVDSDAVIAEALKENKGADAVFTGEGGDAIFFTDSFGLTPADCLRNGRNLSGFFSAAINTAQITEQSIPKITWNALQYGVFGKRWSYFDELAQINEQSFLHSESLLNVKPEDVLHPWITSDSQTPPAKLHHILGVTDMQNNVWPEMTHNIVDRVNVLASQPLIELMYRIPTYNLSYGGRDRALARDAFTSLLPNKVIRRKGKAGISRYINRTLVENAAFIKNDLFDGHLVHNGVIDQEKLNSVYNDMQNASHLQLTQLLICASSEMWARNFYDKSVKAVA